MLHLEDRWVWDFWLIDDGPYHHVFYLQAPRSLGDPERRHRHATIGHAVSTDLTTWDQLADTLGPGPAGAWDDIAPWTGSIIRVADRWQLYYTGTSSSDDGRIQRIGTAVSDDLIHWERLSDQPLLTADHQWYEHFGDSDWFDESWRDPWLITDPHSGDTLAFICARTAHGPSDQRGAIGLARSADLRHWTAAPPVYAPGLFAQMEVPQVLAVDGEWHLLFCTPDWSHSRRWTQQRAANTTTYHVVGTGPTGPFTTDPEPVATPRSARTCYAGKLHLLGDQLVYLATVLDDDRGSFVGDLTDPHPVRIENGRHLIIEEQSPTNPPASRG
jgi:beta-fructofuranosidase